MNRSVIEGVGFHPLVRHEDPRGMLVEMHRDEWALPVAPVAAQNVEQFYKK